MGHRFEAYCKNYQDIENYEKALADDFKGWCCHHRLETHNSDGKRRLVDITAEELVSLGQYYNISSDELIFLTRSEHRSLHKHSEETKKKIAEAMKKQRFGKNNPVYGRHWYNNGKENKYCYECPSGFTPGRLLK